MLRKRAANFNPKESQLLLDLVKEKDEVFQIKQCNSTILNMKNEAWQDITMRFNAHKDCQESRDEKTLRKRYAALKGNSGKTSTSSSPRNEIIQDESVPSTSKDVCSSAELGTAIKQEKPDELDEFCDDNPLSTEETSLHVIDLQRNQHKHSARLPVAQPATKRVKWCGEKLKLENDFSEKVHKERLRLMRDKHELVKEKLQLEIELLQLQIQNDKKKLEIMSFNQT